MNTLPKETLATLLLVDDEANILASLRRLFRPRGYTVLTAESGAAALTLLEQQTIDLVISDMRMPHMSGAELLASIAQRWPQTVRILLTGYSEISSTIAAINEGSIYKYIAKPWEDNDLLQTVDRALEWQHTERERRRLLELTARQNEELQQLNQNLEEKVRERTAELQQTHDQLKGANEALRRSYGSTIKIFSSLIELRGGVVAGHSRRVAAQAKELALHLGLKEEEAQQVMYAGLLHDVGKISLPDPLLTKAFNGLGREERALVARHPVIAEGLLMGLEPLESAAKYIRHHHERYDGKGFPDGLKGADIPLGARILAVVNDYDALQIGTLATLRHAPGEAKEHIRQSRGSRYDPSIADAFVKLLERDIDADLLDSIVTLRSTALLPGMVLANDLTTQAGVMLLSKGYLLDSNLIRRIVQLEHSTDETFDIQVLRSGDTLS
ncbi:MAG: response regulator receiver modulated metal dependent phosphohydrolase [Halothiobacillaceae bacterium]|nr:MAG: response regulator receiver modulated metal dependent phosphohydrolase [Halothiobacillaceae bacterium]